MAQAGQRWPLCLLQASVRREMKVPVMRHLSCHIFRLLGGGVRVEIRKNATKTINISTHAHLDTSWSIVDARFYPFLGIQSVMRTRKRTGDL